MISYLKHFLQSELKARSKNSNGMEFKKRIWLLYLLDTGLEIALTMFVVYMFNTNLQRMRHIGEELLYVLGALYKQVAVGLIYPFGLTRITAKNGTNVLSKFFFTYLECVIAEINKNQKISAWYVKYVLFILEKTKQKGLIDPLGSSGVKYLSNPMSMTFLLFL